MINHTFIAGFLFMIAASCYVVGYILERLNTTEVMQVARMARIIKILCSVFLFLAMLYWIVTHTRVTPTNQGKEPRRKEPKTIIT